MKRPGRDTAADRLADFTASPRVLRLLPLSAAIGLASAITALGLLDLIGLITNLVYHHRVSATLTPPGGGGLGAVSLAIPVAGGLVIGVMARYGSERIRGHGIPEAMETILLHGSRVQPRLAILKPLSSAISIGTGGPFGAEGPIILTGGAIGSVISQLLPLSAAERKAMLVAGSAAGMSAVFGTPVAAVLLAVELLLFEWKPRSMVMAAVASAVAAAARYRFASWGLMARAPLFPVPHHAQPGELELLAAIAVGLGGGVLAWTLTTAVYGAEDLFKLLPFHWAWWPAIGGIVVALGGLAEPRVLGVGYDTIGDELAGRLPFGVLAGVLISKLIVWSIALGSGTSGGILAPLLIMGAALGGLMGFALPMGSVALWCEIGMAAAVAGVMRSPLTAVIFTFELTRDGDALLPLLLACAMAHLMSVLVLRRSILTEKLARRGFHVMREYAVDPLEALLVREVMLAEVLIVEPQQRVDALRRLLGDDSGRHRQRLYPVLGEGGRLEGVLTWSHLQPECHDAEGDGTVVDRMRTSYVVAYPDETLRHVADRMVTAHVTTMPVVDREDPTRLCGLVTDLELLRARERLLVEEGHRERVLRRPGRPPTRGGE